MRLPVTCTPPVVLELEAAAFAQMTDRPDGTLIGACR